MTGHGRQVIFGDLRPWIREQAYKACVCEVEEGRGTESLYGLRFCRRVDISMPDT